jgi:PLD-like domain
MDRVALRPYVSPTLVLLALDWAPGAERDDFLGFAIKRVPGFGDETESWLPNRIGFAGPARRGGDFPSRDAPIQRFQWWDARIDDDDRGKSFKYTAWPVVGDPDHLHLLESARRTCTVKLPRAVENGIGIWFNRAVVSSQAFRKQFARDTKPLTGKRLDAALDWLGNGMQRVVPDFLARERPVEGAIYHLTDEQWVIPAFKARTSETSLDYDATTKEDGGAEANKNALVALQGHVDFHPRRRAKIMHDKFLVRLKAGKADALLMGSANFTRGGLTTQANVMHTFESPELADLYLQRKRLLEGDPTLSVTAQKSGWSEQVQVGEAAVRVFFPPEPTKDRESIDTIVKAVEGAKSSVVFCIFTPTDAGLRNALFDAGDEGKMMFGLINRISQPKPFKPGETPTADAVARVETYNRSRKNKDVYSHSAFTKSVEKYGFWFEVTRIPGTEAEKFPVYIHHKFVVIDAETDSPTVYTGSANMSAGSLHGNDENLLEVKGSTAFARAYLAEFMRLYEHYRARARQQNNEPPGGAGRERRRQGTCHKGFALAPTSCWAEDDYAEGTPESKSRVAMAHAP